MVSSDPPAESPVGASPDDPSPAVIAEESVASPPLEEAESADEASAESEPEVSEETEENDEPAVEEPESVDETSAESEPEVSEETEENDEPAVDQEDASAEVEDDSAPDEEESSNQVWYVLKVQSNLENRIRESILKRIKIAGLEEYISEIVIPTEKVTEIKSGKKRVTERKFYPGYIMVHLELNDDVWFVIRETPGVGDFVGSGGKPVPMSDDEVARMLGRKEEVEQAEPRLKIDFQKGDRVKIRQGHTFENFEGDVEEVIQAKGLVRVMIQIFGRPTPVELEYWQMEKV